MRGSLDSTGAARLVEGHVDHTGAERGADPYRHLDVPGSAAQHHGVAVVDPHPQGAVGVEVATAPGASFRRLGPIRISTPSSYMTLGQVEGDGDGPRHQTRIGRRIDQWPDGASWGTTTPSRPLEVEQVPGHPAVGRSDFGDLLGDPLRRPKPRGVPIRPGEVVEHRPVRAGPRPGPETTRLTRCTRPSRLVTVPSFSANPSTGRTTSARRGVGEELVERHHEPGRSQRLGGERALGDIAHRVGTDQ